MADDSCAAGDAFPKFGLRVGGIFIIWATSAFATCFPVVTKRVRVLREAVPGPVFQFFKYFGSGVILATGFIHLLEPASDSLGEGNTRAAGGCIADAWGDYPYAFGLCLFSLFMTFFIESLTFRFARKRLAAAMDGNTHNHAHTTGHAHDIEHAGHSHGETHLAPQDALDNILRDMNEEEAGQRAAGHDHAHAQPLPPPTLDTPDSKVSETSTIPNSVENTYYKDAAETEPPSAQLIAVCVLESGVIFHSITIGMTLAINESFTILFIVIIFHQMFEGLGLGSRLAFLRLPPSWNWIPYAGAIVYSLITPLGMAIGLGARKSLSMSSGSASLASGILDAISSGILIYTATVELIAHEFVFNQFYQECSWSHFFFSMISFATGAGIMALLGKWA